MQRTINIKIIDIRLPFFILSLWNSICILHLQHISIQTFQMFNSCTGQYRPETTRGSQYLQHIRITFYLFSKQALTSSKIWRWTGEQHSSLQPSFHIHMLHNSYTLGTQLHRFSSTVVLQNSCYCVVYFFFLDVYLSPLSSHLSFNIQCKMSFPSVKCSLVP